jgi:hypothetical protein
MLHVSIFISRCGNYLTPIEWKRLILVNNAMFLYEKECEERLTKRNICVPLNEGKGHWKILFIQGLWCYFKPLQICSEPVCEIAHFESKIQILKVLFPLTQIETLNSGSKFLTVKGVPINHIRRGQYILHKECIFRCVEDFSYSPDGSCGFQETTNYTNFILCFRRQIEAYRAKRITGSGRETAMSYAALSLRENLQKELCIKCTQENKPEEMLKLKDICLAFPVTMNKELLKMECNILSRLINNLVVYR